MKIHRYRCFSPFWAPRHAWAMAYAHSGNRDPESRDCSEEPGAGTWYSHRDHDLGTRRGRQRSRHAGSFGVRRPLRYLSYQLDLDDSQRRRIAAVLDSVKVEQEQAALDEKKMILDLAELVAAPEVSTEALEEALAARVRSAEAVQTHSARALKEIVAALDPDQREEFAFLLRTGAFRI